MFPNNNKKLLGYLCIILIATSPLMAQEVLHYTIEVADVTRSVMFFALFLIWPLKSWLSYLMLKCPYRRLLLAQFFTTLFAFFIYCFIYFIVPTIIFFYLFIQHGQEYFEGDQTLWYAKLFSINASRNILQWDTLLLNFFIILTMTFPITLIEVIQLHQDIPSEQATKTGKYLFISNIVFFTIIALVNALAIVMRMLKQ